MKHNSLNDTPSWLAPPSPHDVRAAERTQSDHSMNTRTESTPRLRSGVVCGAFLLSILLSACSGTGDPETDLHQHRKMVDEKPMAERETGAGTWIRDSLGRPHYVWPKEDPDTTQ